MKKYNFCDIYFIFHPILSNILTYFYDSVSLSNNSLAN